MSGTGAGERLLGVDDLAGFGALGPLPRWSTRTAISHRGRAPGRGRVCGPDSSDGKGTVITLKALRSAGEGGAVHRRREVEGPADAFDTPGDWPASDARELMVELIGDAPLADLVTIRQTRHKRNYGRDGTVVELSVDDVEVVSGERVIERFAELELELREGEEAAMEPLADLLAEIEELVPAETSKLERALEAVRREPAADGGAGQPDDVRTRWRRDPGHRPCRPGGRTRRRPARDRGGGDGRIHPAQGARRDRGGPPGRGWAQGASLPPCADDGPRGGNEGRHRQRGAPRDARRDATSAGGVAGVRRGVRSEADGPASPAPARSHGHLGCRRTELHHDVEQSRREGVRLAGGRSGG